MTWGFRLLRVAAAAALALVAPQAGAKPSMRAEQPAAARLTLKLDLKGSPRDPSWFALAAPDRLVVDVSGARAEAATVDGRGFVTRVRLAQFDRETARLVIDLAEPARVADTHIEDGAVSITLAPTTPEDFARLPKLGRFAAVPPATVGATSLAGLIPAGALAPSQRERPEPARTASTMTGDRPLIVLDPGHGGHDVGAVSVYEGRFEKDATLAIARAVKRELEASGRFRVKLTRDSDFFIPLPGRVKIARDAGADLFLSIHADSAPNPDASGATVYTLSDVASDKLAARVAARENRAGIIHGVELNGEEPEVAGLIYAMVQRGTMNASADFAQKLQRAMPGEVRFKGDYHRFAGFAVLKTGDTPAALLETGYVTNEADARFLFSPEGQKALATGVRAALEAYFPTRVASSGGGVGRVAGNR